MTEQVRHSYQPSKVSPPGDTLIDILEERGMTQAELAERAGRPLKTINEIVKGKTTITPETAIQLERVLGVSAEFWNQREANYRSYLAREKEVGNLATHKNWLKNFPLNEMKKRRLIGDQHSSVASLVIAILNFFGVASPEQWDAGWTKKRLAFRKAMNLSSDGGATAVWLRQGEVEAERIRCQPFDRERLVELLPDIRALTIERDPAVFIPRLRDLCASCGVAVVFVKPFPGVPVYGASCWLNSEKALIQLSFRGKTADILWFTIFHELGHVLKHSKKELFVEIDSKETEKNAEEKEADAFASETLISATVLNDWLDKTSYFSEENVKAFSERIGVAPGVVVGRLQYMQLLPFSSLNKLKFRYQWVD